MKNFISEVYIDDIISEGVRGALNFAIPMAASAAGWEYLKKKKMEDQLYDLKLKFSKQTDHSKQIILKNRIDKLQEK